MNNSSTQTPPPRYHVAIIGGGITGLSAAWELQQQVPDSSNILFEGSGRLGGKIETHILPGPNGSTSFISDAGPESFVTRKPEAWTLAAELGVTDQVQDPGSETRGIYVLDEGEIHPVPLGPLAFIRSQLLTPRGKLRLLAEPFIRPKADDEDESLADFAGRRLGNEATQKFIGPILGGIYNANPEKQSILTTSPIMREMEKDHGSLVRALIHRLRTGRKPQAATDPKKPRFMSFPNGAEQLVAALGKALTTDVHLNAPVVRIEKTVTGYVVHTQNGETVEADSVILATPANISAQMLTASFPEISNKLDQIRHENAGTIALTYAAADLPNDLDIIGLMIPRRENRNIDAVQFTSLKMPERAPDGFCLIRVFFGGGNPETVHMSDEELIGIVRQELGDLIGIDAAPLTFAISRWPAGFPQADVGHLDRITRIESLLPDGLVLAGSSYRGIAVPDCIRQGRTAAKKVCALNQHKTK